MDALKPLGIDPALIIAYLINFILLLLLLRLFLYRPILNMLAERRRKVEDSLAQADKVRQQAEVQRAEFQRELEDARRVSQDAATRATQEVEKMREAIVVEARKDAEQIREQARQQVNLERQQAMAEIQREVVNLSVDMTRRVLGRTVKVDEKAQRLLIRQFLKESGDLS